MWNESKASSLREFLSQPIGQEFLEELKSVQTKITGKNNEERLITANEFQGGQKILDHIKELQTYKDSQPVKDGFIHEEEYLNG